MKSKIYLFLKLSVVIFLLQSCVVKTRPVVRHSTKVVYIKAPKHHKIVVVKGKKYHYWNGKYHRKTKKGYIVVMP